MIKDLTVGKSGEVLWKYTIPMFIGVAFQQMYNIADSIIAGKYAGEDALAAVGASYPITAILMALAIGTQMGCSIVVSQLFGAKKYTKMKSAITTSMITGLVMSAVFTVLGLVLNSWMMTMINTPDNVLKDGELYLGIYILGFVFLFMYNVSTGIFNSLGDSKTPLYLLIGSSIINVVLDYVFVAIFSWGVAGVAWATFIAQGGACILALIILRTRVVSIQCEKGKIFDKKILRDISMLAIPSILQQSFISIGNLIIQIVINGYGSSVIAGYSAAIKLNTFIITSFTTIGNGVSGFTAQNIGASKPDRVREGFKTAILIAEAIGLVSFLLYFFGGGMLLELFMNEESTQLARSTGVDFMHIVTPFYLLICVKLVSDGVLRGSGAMKYFMISTFTDLILRVLLAIVFSMLWGVIGIWLSWPVGWLCGTALSFMFYRCGKWKNKLA